MDRRNSDRRSSGLSRGLRVLIVTAVLPPLGIFVMWFSSVFRRRGRMIITALACIEMTVLLVWDPIGLMPDPTAPIPVMPVPGLATAVTPAPDIETLNALSNIDDLLAMTVTDENGQIDPQATPRLTQAQELALKEEILDTVVYSVFRNAKYYHASTVCGNQSNGRQLTIREAIEEGMGACPDCNPPVP